MLKPVDGSGGKGIVIGSQADSTDPGARRGRRSWTNPRGWIAQREIALSTVPTLIGDKMRPRHVDLRPFAVNNGNSVWVLPGGLTRVALPEGELVVNSSQGGGSKDTWVLADHDADRRPNPADRPRSARDGGHPGDDAGRLDPDDGRFAQLGFPAAAATGPSNQQACRAAARPAAAGAGRRDGRRIAMLSRIAESLYWLGRHVERADCTARILDTYLHLLPAGSWQADHQVIRSLLDSMGLSDDETVGAGSQADSGQLVRALVFDGERAVVGRRRADRRPGERPRRARRHPAGRLGVPQRHLARAAHPGGERRRAARVPALGR